MPSVTSNMRNELTLPEVCRALGGLSWSTVYNLVLRGKLKARQVRGRYRITRKSLERYIASAPARAVERSERGRLAAEARWARARGKTMEDSSEGSRLADALERIGRDTAIEKVTGSAPTVLTVSDVIARIDEMSPEQKRELALQLAAMTPEVERYMREEIDRRASGNNAQP